MMKLWQLVSIMRANSALLEPLTLQRDRWHFMQPLFADFNGLVDRQERPHLDLVLPEDFVTHVLAQSMVVVFLGKDGWLRSRAFERDDEDISILTAYVRYGGQALEEVLESGALNLESSERKNRT